MYCLHWQLCKTALCGLCIPWQCSCVGKGVDPGQEGCPKVRGKASGQRRACHLQAHKNPARSRRQQAAALCYMELTQLEVEAALLPENRLGWLQSC